MLIKNVAQIKKEILVLFVGEILLDIAIVADVVKIVLKNIMMLNPIFALFVVINLYKFITIKNK